MEKIRRKLDQIDEQILILLQQRKELVLKIANVKQDSNLSLKQPEREKVVLEKVSQLSKKLNLDQTFTQELFKSIIRNSLEEQQKT